MSALRVIPVLLDVERSALTALASAWRWLRAATGDDAYERYIEHHSQAHPGEPVMTRAAFYEQTLQRKWSGVSRCC